MQWYRNDRGQAVGPMGYEDLQALAATGRLAPADQVWSPGFAEWVTAADIPGLIPRRAPPAVAAAPPPAAEAPRAEAVTLPPASLGDAPVVARDPAGPRLAHAEPSWPPPPPAPGSPMPPSRKLAAPVDPAALAATARARLVAPAAPRPAQRPTNPPARPFPPPPRDADAQHDRA
jgi:hypothetical protein